MNTTPSIVELLDAIRDHLAVFELPQPFIVEVCREALRRDGHVSVHVDGYDGLPGVASSLLAWTDTLSAATVQLWRPHNSAQVHVHVIGHLTDGTRVCVWSGTQYSPTVANVVGMEPGERRQLPVGVLREWAGVR
ncbi:hypothetical protein [Actinocrispum wychmicini]|uniref:Uncharacterized protein n=1 Tax=Actinocrispum wychmicini TaxID=1213861 RepID=A0A4R2ILB8_9PSEU|nr:hypothetical protein [Actinocrispum wychmicini]TCO45941.1 hypothetical protein EV192_120127 [Actinocrispum wychmicini]